MTQDEFLETWLPHIKPVDKEEFKKDLDELLTYTIWNERGD